MTLCTVIGEERTAMSEHPYKIPDPLTCPKCGRGRYIAYGQRLHFNNHSEDCNAPTKAT